MNHIFLDNASTTAVRKEVVEKMLPFFTENFGNPSGMHFFARKAKKALNQSREIVASILNCTKEEIIFTSGGTESNNLAIFGSSYANTTKNKNHLITSLIEHAAVLEPFKRLKKENFKVDFLSPTQNGEITENILKKALRKETLLISLMWANNEIGTINNIKKLASLTKKKEIIFHSDACQAGGSLELDVKKLGIDLMTLNGSKIHGPKGIGILFKSKNLKIKPQILGGSYQEGGLRGGTENLPFIVGLAEALRLAQKEREKEVKRLQKLQQKIKEFILHKIPLSRLNGAKENRLVNNLHFSFLNTEGESLMLLLDEAGFATATSSACSSENLKPSHVLLGINMPYEIAHGSLRITLGKNNTEKEINNFLLTLEAVVKKVRQRSAINFTKKDFPQWF